jgi:hypothetical protein
MKTHSRALWAALAACALLVGAPGVASAAPPVISKLRVEARGQALSPGVFYVNNTARLATRSSECSGTGQTQTVRGPSAIGVVDYAQETNRTLAPYFVSDQFDFGLIVCRIGNAGAFNANEAWLYKVNHKAAQVGGDQFPLSRGDRVLWYFADFATGANTGDELELRAPARVQPNSPFTVTAIAYNGEGVARPAAGATIAGGATAAVTKQDGTAQVTLPNEGRTKLRASRPPNDIPAAPTTVCVNATLSRCPERRGEFIVGTDRPEPIVGTVAPDLVYARAGDDQVDVRNGGADAVSCGPGNDNVLAGGLDRLGADCERLNGRARG